MLEYCETVGECNSWDNPKIDCSNVVSKNKKNGRCWNINCHKTRKNAQFPKWQQFYHTKGPLYRWINSNRVNLVILCPVNCLVSRPGHHLVLLWLQSSRPHPVHHLSADRNNWGISMKNKISGAARMREQTNGKRGYGASFGPSQFCHKRQWICQLTSPSLPASSTASLFRLAQDSEKLWWSTSPLSKPHHLMPFIHVVA